MQNHTVKLFNLLQHILLYQIVIYFGINIELTFSFYYYIIPMILQNQIIIIFFFAFNPLKTPKKHRTVTWIVGRA